jgi:hypothetical protein
VIGLALILVGLVLIACGMAWKRHTDAIIDEILAVELRQIDRERKQQRQREYDANLSARWRG